MENSDGTSRIVCDDGGQPETIIICSYQQLHEVGVWEEVCYEIEIPEGCVLETAEAGVWKLVCDEDSEGVKVTPLG